MNQVMNQAKSLKRQVNLLIHRYQNMKKKKWINLRNKQRKQQRKELKRLIKKVNI